MKKCNEDWTEVFIALSVSGVEHKSFFVGSVDCWFTNPNVVGVFWVYRTMEAAREDYPDSEIIRFVRAGNKEETR